MKTNVTVIEDDPHISFGLEEVLRSEGFEVSSCKTGTDALATVAKHKPELIILDEPTIGLDPNQIRSVRQLIKSLGGKHTVLISTHILPEVEMTCNRVLILHQGKILASDTTENLQRIMSDGGQVVAEIAAPEAELRECWEGLEEVEYYNISPIDGAYYRCALTPTNGADLRPRVFQVVSQRGWSLRELTLSRHSLEDIFVHMTRTNKEEEGL